MAGGGGGGSGNSGGKGGTAGCFLWQSGNSYFFGAWGGDGGTSSYNSSAATSPAVSVSSSSTFGKGGLYGSGFYSNGTNGLAGKLDISCL